MTTSAQRLEPAGPVTEPSTAARATAAVFGARSPRWVPVRTLGARHRGRIAAHLRALSPADRYLRFGRAVSDHMIQGYVEGLDFDRDQLFGIFNRRLQLIAMAHLAYDTPPQFAARPAMVEFGVSVASAARGRGYGRLLFRHAVMHARNRGTDTLFIHALTENAAMLHIARSAGASVERDGSESQAFLKLPADTLASQVEQLVETHAAELNYGLKRHALRIRRLFDAIACLRRQVAHARVASQ
jgi:GNAT superfamily N-acetyltransferase